MIDDPSNAGVAATSANERRGRAGGPSIAQRWAAAVARGWASAAVLSLIAACTSTPGPADGTGDGSTVTDAANDGATGDAGDVGDATDAPVAVALAAGEAIEVSHTDGTFGVRLATPAGTERFVLVHGSTRLDGSAATGTYRIVRPAVAAVSPTRTLRGCAITPDRWRAMMLPTETPPSGAAPALGTERMFTVPLPGGASEVITARVVAVGERSVTWADTTVAHPANLDPMFVTAFVDAFDRTILPRERTVFGMESDIDSDGRISLLFTPLTYRTAVAYFRGCDLQNLAGCRAMNRGELLYLTPPTTIRPPYNTLAAINEILSHELGHLIHFGRKVLRNRLAAWPDNAYLIEGVGALAQDVIGYQSGNLYVTQAGLNQIDDFSLGDILVDGAPYDPTRDGLLRGGAYLFVRYLYDRGGGDLANAMGGIDSRGGPVFLRSLLDAPRSITRDLANMTGLTLEDVAKDYFTALGGSNRNDNGEVAPTNDCFRYLPVADDPVTMRPRGANVFASFHGMRMTGPASRPLAEADGAIWAGGADYLVAEAAAGTPEIAFDLAADPAIEPFLRILRVR